MLLVCCCNEFTHLRLQLFDSLHTHIQRTCAIEMMRSSQTHIAHMRAICFYFAKSQICAGYWVVWVTFVIMFEWMWFDYICSCRFYGWFYLRRYFRPGAMYRYIWSVRNVDGGLKCTKANAGMEYFGHSHALANANYWQILKHKIVFWVIFQHKINKKLYDITDQTYKHLFSLPYQLCYTPKLYFLCIEQGNFVGTSRNPPKVGHSLLPAQPGGRWDARKKAAFPWSI